MSCGVIYLNPPLPKPYVAVGPKGFDSPYDNLLPTSKYLTKRINSLKKSSSPPYSGWITFTAFFADQKQKGKVKASPRVGELWINSPKKFKMAWNDFCDKLYEWHQYKWPRPPEQREAPRNAAAKLRPVPQRHIRQKTGSVGASYGGASSGSVPSLASVEPPSCQYWDPSSFFPASSSHLSLSTIHVPTPDSAFPTLDTAAMAQNNLNALFSEYPYTYAPAEEPHHFDFSARFLMAAETHPCQAPDFSAIITPHQDNLTHGGPSISGSERWDDSLADNGYLNLFPSPEAEFSVDNTNSESLGSLIGNNTKLESLWADRFARMNAEAALNWAHMEGQPFEPVPTTSSDSSSN